MKSQTYIFLYSLNVSHCSKASHYKITHLQMVQGLLFSFGISNRNKSAHSSRHTFSSICVCLCMAHMRGMLPRKTLHHRSCLERWWRRCIRELLQKRLQAAAVAAAASECPAGPHSPPDGPLLGKHQRKAHQGDLQKRVSTHTCMTYPEAMSQYFLCRLPGLCQHLLPGVQLQLPKRCLYYFPDLCSILNKAAGLMFNQVSIISLKVKVRVFFNDPQVSLPRGCPASPWSHFLPPSTRT